MNRKPANPSHEVGQASIYAAFAIFVFTALLTSCGRREFPLDTAWSFPENFSGSQSALNSSFGIVNLNGEPVCVDGSDFYFLGTSGTNWTKRTFSRPAGIEHSSIIADSTSTKFIFCHGEVQGGRLDSDVTEGKLQAKFTFCKMHPALGIETIYDRDLALDSKELFGEIKRLSDETPLDTIWRQQYGPPLITPSMGWLGGGIIVGKDIYIPYMVECSAFYGSQKETGGSGPWQTGILHSTEDYSRWTRLKLFDIYTMAQSAFVTHDNLYFFVQRLGENNKNVWGLWCSRMPRTADAPSAPERVVPTYRADIFGGYSVATDNDTIHLVWLDGRHVSGGQLYALAHDRADRANLELYYRSRKDSASVWTTEILLSKGLRFVFSPSMAVEGNNMVVVWQGYQEGYGEFVPSDIYFTTSRDGGKTWTPTARATDNAKSGLVSGRPSVALHNGVIHLFYIQGKRENIAGAGQRQDGWPIIYQHRLFPEK